MNPRKTTPMVAETLTLAQLALLLALPLILVVPTWGDDSDSNVSASLPQGVQDVEEARIAAIERAVPASIGVFGPGASGGGSGVVISADGFALTNFHVVQPSGNYMQCTMPDGELYDAVVVGVDPTGDVALIKLMGRDDFPVATWGDSDALAAGDWCFTVGNPFLLATDFQPSVAYGIVSGVHRYQYPAGTLLEYADCIQTDAAINPGNSGGPLFNAQGELVGINGRGSFEKRGRVNVGVGYAISINQIKHFLGYLHSGRIVDHATLGATVATDEDGRVIVTNILESSDAFRRGLRYNDEIVSLGGRTIDSANALKNVVGTYPRGWRIPLSFRRDGKRFDVLVRLSGVHRQEELIQKVTGVPVEPPNQPDSPDPEKGPDGEDSEKSPGDENRPEDDQSPEGPRRLRPRQRLREMLKRPKMPIHVTQQFEERRGYANYYFNKLNQDRLWNGFTAKKDPESLRHEWVLRGALDNGDAIEIILRDDEAFLSWPDGPVRLDLNGEIDALLRQRLLPDGTIVEDIGLDHGMLLSLSMWRKFVLDGIEKFGDVYYLGTTPIPTRPEAVDVLVATRGVVENHLWFDPETTGMLGVESFYDVGRDPVELEFSRESHAGEEVQKLIPNGLSVHMGSDVLVIQDLRMDNVVPRTP